MLSLRELQRAAAVLNRELSGHRLERVVQPAADQLVLSFYGRDSESGEAGKRHLMMSCRPGNPIRGRTSATGPRDPGVRRENCDGRSLHGH